MTTSRRRVWLRGVVLTLVAGAAAAAAPGAPARVDAAALRLSGELRALLDAYPRRGARWSVLVVSLDRGDTLFALAPDSARTPASNMKLLTSAAALRELGPDYRYRTWVVTRGTQEGSTLHGDLVLYGTGDPGISDRFHASKTTVFEALADQLLDRGITRVTGRLVGDESFLPGPLRPSGWEPEDLNDHFAAAVSALSFNENVVSLRVEPAPAAGLPPTVHTHPDRSGLPVDNRAVTSAGPGLLLILRDDPTEPVVVRGSIRQGGRAAWRELTVGDPAAFTVSVFRSVLEARGIQVEGGDVVVRDPSASVLGATRITAPAVAKVPRTRILATHLSPPLSEYLALMNKRSNNLVSELVFRTVGRMASGNGSPEASADAVAASLVRLGVDTAGLVQRDGSGLDAANRSKAVSFVDLLRRMAASPEWPHYWATLPEAGNRRELGRMFRTPAAGNLRAKTGTIRGVSALSGVVQSQDGERLAFSILVNEARSTVLAKRVENDLGAALASFRRDAGTPPLERAVQLPPPPIPTDSGGVMRHQVARGESLHGIARRYGLTLEELRRANPDADPARLRPGTWLVIPMAGGDPPPSGAR